MTGAAAVPVLVEEGLGFVQRCSYRHPDLYHEDVLEIDSPLATVNAAGVQSFRFLLMGDQNAGKSTFLHSFTNEEDAHFIELASLLPMLHSSFSNARYLDPKSTSLHMTDDASTATRTSEASAVLAAPFAMDELPFLDTDLGSAALLVTRENFEFFLFECNLTPGRRVQTSKLLSTLSQEEEEELDVPLLDEEAFKGLYDDPDGTRYVLLQFQEIGGDLLDLLMLSDEDIATANQGPLASDHLRMRLGVRTKTLSWLNSARKTVYFVNATSLCKVMPQPSMSQAFTTLLLERMDFLNKTFPDGHDVLLHVSRMPEGLPEDDCAVTVLTDTLSDLLFDAYGVENSWRGSKAAVEAPPPGIRFSEEADTTPGKARWGVSALLRCFLEEMGRQRQWRLRFIMPHAMPHLKAAGSINSSGVMHTLVALFEHGMVNSRTTYDDSVAVQLVRIASKLSLRLWSCDGHQGNIVDWLDLQRFHEALIEEEHCDDGEVPQHAALAAFGRVSKRLCELGLCITEKRNSRDSLVAEVVDADGVHFWSPSCVEPSETEAPRMRLLQFAPDVNAVIVGLFNTSVPLDMWGKGEISLHATDARLLLDENLPVLKALMATVFVKFLEAPESEGIVSALRHEAMCIMEELSLVARMLGRAAEPVPIQVTTTSPIPVGRLQGTQMPPSRVPTVRISLASN